GLVARHPARIDDARSSHGTIAGALRLLGVSVSLDPPRRSLRRTRRRLNPVALPATLVMATLVAAFLGVLWLWDRAAEGAGTDREPASAPTETTLAQPQGAAASPEPLPDAEFTIGAAGDVIPHPTVVRYATTPQGYDCVPLLEATRAWSEGVDVAICNLETPLIPAEEEPSGFPLFGAPEAFAHDLAELGWNGCSTANNHTLDR